MRDRRWLMIVSIFCVSLILLFLSGNVFNNQILIADPSQFRNLDEPTPEMRPGVKDIHMQVSMDSKEFEVLTQLQQQYQVIHSDISIKLENIPSHEAYVTWKKTSQLGEAADIMLLNNSWVTEFAALGYLMPVDSFLTSDLVALQMEQAVSQVKWNGYTWGVPKDVDAYVMAYSTLKLAELGMTKPPSLAEELIALHSISSKPDEGKYGIYIDFKDPQAFLSLAKSLGGAKTQVKTAPLKFTEPALGKAFELILADPSAKERSNGLAKIFPAASTPQWNPWELLQQGHVAGILTTYSEYKLNASGKESVVMAGLPLPRGEAIWKSSWLKGRSFAISSRSDFPEEAFEWIKEITSTNANLKFWVDGFKLPSTTNSYSISGIKNDASVQRVADFLDKDDAIMKGPHYNRQLQQLESAMNRLWKGELNWALFSEQMEQLWGGPGSSSIPAASNVPTSSTQPNPSIAPSPNGLSLEPQL